MVDLSRASGSLGCWFAEAFGRNRCEVDEVLGLNF